MPLNFKSKNMFWDILKQIMDKNLPSFNIFSYFGNIE